MKNQIKNNTCEYLKAKIETDTADLSKIADTISKRANSNEINIIQKRTRLYDNICSKNKS